MDSGSTRLAVGAEITFQLNYSALVRAMTSPFVSKVMKDPSGLVARQPVASQAAPSH